MNGFLVLPTPPAFHLCLEVPLCLSDRVLNLIAVTSVSAYSPGMTKHLMQRKVVSGTRAGVINIRC